MSISEKLQELGWVCLEIESGTSLLELAAKLGSPTPDASGSMNRFLVAKHQSSAKQNTTSGVYGLSSFPFHTDYAHLDAPPRYLLLRSHFGRSSTATTLLNPLNTFGNAWVDLIKHATWRISSGVRSRAGIMHLSRTSHGFRWDPHLMQPLNKLAVSASVDFKHSLHNCPSTHVHTWENSQQALLIDNWHVLHGRGDATETEHRCMERVFLKEIFCV